MKGLAQWWRAAGLKTVIAVICGTVFGFPVLQQASAAKLSSIVIDADTGQVLEEHNADLTNYPASLTKMMTLYLTFEGLKSGRLALDQSLPVSAHAASRAPSKLGLKAGESVPVRDLVLGVVTKSANDAATVLAEGEAGGSETAFAERMTAKARQLGMKNTFYHNASGLPDPLQRTTARDVATLARALHRDFPQYYHYFSTREFSFHGVIFANHNHLMSSYPGMDGIKTGYIRASGFNLAASAVRGNRRLIGVVMGGESTRLRDNHMAALLNAAFIGQSGEVMVAKASGAEGHLAQAGVAAAAALSPVGSAEAAPPALHPRAVRTSAKAAERWSVQLGAFTRHAAAERAIALALAKVPSAKGRRTEILVPRRTDKERLYRARLLEFSKREATSACRSLHRKHLRCSVVAPEAHLAAS